MKTYQYKIRVRTSFHKDDTVIEFGPVRLVLMKGEFEVMMNSIQHLMTELPLRTQEGLLMPPPSVLPKSDSGWSMIGLDTTRQVFFFSFRGVIWEIPLMVMPEVMSNISESLDAYLRGDGKPTDLSEPIICNNSTTTSSSCH